MPLYIKKENLVGVVANLLSWTISEAYVAGRKTKGERSVIGTGFFLLLPMPKFIRMFCGCASLGFRAAFLSTRNYHIADVNLFYLNIRQNVEERINAYLK